MGKDGIENLKLKKFKIKDIVPNATILLLGKRRTGKCCKKATKVLLFDGSFKNIEDIKIGDRVMGDDSTARNVLETHFGIDTMYTITNANGLEYTVNSEHVLCLKYTGKKKIRDIVDSYQVSWFNNKSIKFDYRLFSYKDKNKEKVFLKAQKYFENIVENRYVDIPVKDFLKLSKKYRNSLYGYQVSINFEKKELTIDPYVMGHWLCDLSKTNNPKSIPMIYKCNSRELRLKLLAGLLDSGGYLNNSKRCFMFTQNNEKLFDDVLYLCRSLGFSSCATVNKQSCMAKYSMCISGNGIHEIPTIYLKRAIKTSSDTLASAITIKELPEKDEYFGIELDGNNRYVLGNFIVTHNSWLVKDIFANHCDIPAGVIFSGTESANPFFGDFIPDAFIHSEYDPELIEGVLSRQGKKVRDSRKLAKQTLNGANTKMIKYSNDRLKEISKNGLTESNRFFIVLDDMLADANAWKKEKTIQEIFFNGRHFNIFFILTMQYPLGIPPALRSNIDYVFIFNEPSIINRKHIYLGYASMIPTFDHFCNILDACTENFQCLVIKTSGSNSNKVEDQVFWYRASEHDDFRVGHPKIWKFHNDNYNTGFVKEDDQQQEKLEELHKKYKNTRKLKVIISREDGEIVDYQQESD